MITLSNFYPIIKKFWCVCDRSQGGAEILEKRPTKQLLKLNLTPRQKSVTDSRDNSQGGAKILEKQPTKHLIKLTLEPPLSVIARH